MKNNFTSIILLSVLVVGLLIGIIDLNRRVNTAGEQVAQLHQQISTKDTLRAATQSEQTAITALSPEVDAVHSYLIPADGTATFIDQVENIAHDLGLTIVVNTVSVQSDPDLASTKLEYLRLRVVVAGSWADVYTFVSHIENMPYAVAIGQVDFAQVSNAVKGSKPGWQTTIDFSVIKQVSPSESRTQ